jgi:hypothetical protein
MRFQEGSAIFASANSRMNPDKTFRPIADLLLRPDFPEGIVGEFVDIRGYAGEVVAVAHNSIRVKTPDGVTRGFNVHVLRKLYGPRPEEPAPPPPSPAVEEPAPAPAPQQIENPNFDQEVKLISHFVSQRDFPQCTLGQHVDIRGYQGVVVQIADHSLIVRARDGASRRYNADVLRKLHGGR